MSLLWRLWNYIRTLLGLSPDEAEEPTAAAESIEAEPQTSILPPLSPPPEYIGPKAKWVKPKGLEKLKKPDFIGPKLPRKPTIKRDKPIVRPDDNPEKWGQYYFRDAILDQLDVYFKYLRRMRHSDRDAYHLHRKLGIQIMPKSAIRTFEKWRNEGETQELSDWWKTHRPAFGAISYGIDDVSVDLERIRIVDGSPEAIDAYDKLRADTKHRRNAFDDNEEKAHNIVEIYRGHGTATLPTGERDAIGLMWVPKFLYFVKYKKPPPEVQQISDGGDIYKLTVYFDRTDGQSRSFHKRNKGGFPQDYAVCIERNGTHVRILRRLISERITIVGRDGTFTIPNKHWGIGNMQFAHGREDFSPEEYLSRIFVEAALMYESSALGSMIRIEATKGRLAATFGVDVKRTSYFFKDRDVTLNKSGRRARIFHIVRPHIRKTRAGEIAVKLHFRGLRVFEWAGYKISITVPGLDHFILPELDVGIYDKASVRKDDKRRWMTSGALATRLADGMKLGLGGRK